jgi:hypothetical protein
MSDQCAIAPDGSLKNAADIQWFNDADDDVPLPSRAPSQPLTSASASSSVRSLDNFFSSHLRAKKVSGERHSSRIRKPSKRTTDPDNAEAPGDTPENAPLGRKRKAGTVTIYRRVSRKIIESDSNSDGRSDGHSQSDADTEANSDEDLDEARATANYERMKALGDKDRDVTSSHFNV